MYFGAVIQIDNKKEADQHISQHGIGIRVTRRLKEACDTTKPTIGFLLGHHEISRKKMQQITGELSHSANIESLYIDQFTDLNEYKVICLVGPKESIQPRGNHPFESIPGTRRKTLYRT